MECFGFDLDGVLYPWHTVAYDYIKYHKGETRPYAQFWQDAIDNVGMEKYSEIFWNNLVSIEILYGRIPANQRDVQTLQELSKRFEIVYITHRPESVARATINWLKRYNFPNPTSVYMSQEPKDMVVRLVGCDYYIEDRPEILRSNLKSVTNLIAMRTLWNWTECESLPYVDWIYQLPDLLERI